MTGRQEETLRRLAVLLRYVAEHPGDVLLAEGLDELLDSCPDHGALDGGRCYECEHDELLVDTELERRAFG